MSEPTTHAPRGRRTAAGRRLNPTVVIGVVLVALTVGALLLVFPHEAADRSAGPQTATLTAASVGCPAALPGAGTVSVATGEPGLEGDVTVTGGDEPETVALAAPGTSTVDTEGPVAVTGTGDMAAGLLAARFGGDQLAAVDCPRPSPEAWFTGVGAGARHDSVIELVNPDEGPAVADISVYGRGGPVDVPGLRGVTVRGQDSVRLRLGQLLPRRSELALHVAVSRGRLAASLLDQVPSLGARPGTEDFLPSQPAPANDQVLLGLPEGEGEDVLAVANPGEDEARVKVKVLTVDSEFAPEGLEELRVAPGTVRTVSLTSILRSAVREGAIGLTLTSTRPVTATVRSVVGDDLSHAAPVTASSEPMTLLVPPGDGRVLLGAASGVGVATVSAWTAEGRALEPQEIELEPGQGGVVDLPRGAALVRVETRRSAVHAAALVTGPGGAAVLGFRELLTEALIPDVRPGLS